MPSSSANSFLPAHEAPGLVSIERGITVEVVAARRWRIGAFPRLGREMSRHSQTISIITAKALNTKSTCVSGSEQRPEVTVPARLTY